MKLLSLLLLMILSVFFSDAQKAPGDTAQHIILDTLNVSAPPGPPVYRGAATRVWEIKNTRIALNFNWKEKTADAREWITLHPYFYATDSLVLDAKSMRIDSVMLVGKKGNIRLNYTYESDQLKIRFGQQYKSNETVDLLLKYTAMPYAMPTGGSGAISDDRGLYFINTDYSVPNKPAQIWTQGETESNSHWLITIDKPNTRFTTQVELTVPDSFTTLSNGAVIKSMKGTRGLRTDIWKMDMPIQAYAVMFAIGKFDINKNKWRNKEVNYYVEADYAPYSYLMFNHTPDMMEYFSQRTGVLFPWNKYSQVVVRDYVSGAMENTSAALFGEFMNQDAREIADRNNEDVVSHELFHEWFGDYVTCESWSNITVNESFANYGEQLWRTHKYGKASGEELAYNDLQGYIAGAQYSDPQLVRYYYESREEVFDHVSYNKGGAVLRYMNNLMGDAAFDKAMNIYLTKNALHSADAQNWRQAAEEATGQDWNWFFNEWYYHAGHPVVKVVYDYNDSTQRVTVTVSQTQDDSAFIYRLPLKTAIIYGKDKTVADWNITRKTETFSYPYRNGQKPLIVPDYTHVLPGELKDGKQIEEWRQQFALTDDYVSKRLALSAAGRLMSDSSSQAILGMALNDNIHSIRRSALSILGRTQNEKYQKKWTEYVTYLAKNDSDRLVRAEAFDVLGDWKDSAAKGLILEAVNYSSYAIAGAALSALYKITDKDTAYVLAKKLLNTHPRSTLENAIWNAIGKKGADEDIALYERRALYVSGNMKFAFSLSLKNYLKNVSSNGAFTKGVDLFVTLVISEELKSRRAPLTESLFNVAEVEKENLKSDQKEEADIAKPRLEIVKTALQKVLAAEKDPEMLKDDEKKMRSIFE